MELNVKISKTFLIRKLTTAVLVAASICAFATLGDGGKDAKNTHTILLNAKTFNLRSGYNYRSNNLLNLPVSKRFIMLNTMVTYQRGNSSFVMPLKKKVLLDKIRINPTTIRF